MQHGAFAIYMYIYINVPVVHMDAHNYESDVGHRGKDRVRIVFSCGPGGYAYLDMQCLTNSCSPGAGPSLPPDRQEAREVDIREHTA